MLNQPRTVLSEFCRLIILVTLLCAFWLLSGIAQSKFPTGKYSNGDFMITFNDDGSHSVSLNDNIVVKGNYTITQDQIMLTDKEGQYACDAAKPGKYKWKVEDKGLKFEKVEDECEGRAGALSGQSWVKK